MKKGAFRFPMIKIAGGENPDPAIYCPANGYYSPILPEYEEPIQTPTPSAEVIILTCEDKEQRIVTFRVQLSSTGTVNCEVYNSADELLYAKTTASGTKITFNPINDPVPQFYYIKIYPADPLKTISLFTVDTTTGYETDYPILAAKFNTPNLTSLLNSFFKQSQFKKFTRISTLDLLTNTQGAFSYSGITHFTFPDSMNSLNQATSMFSYSDINFIDFNNCNMPLLAANAQSMLAYTYKLQTVIFNPIIPACTNMISFFQGSNVENLTLSPTLSTNTITFSLSNLCNGCQFLKTLILPEFPISYTIGFSSAFTNCPSLNYIEFRGASKGTGSTIFTNTTNIETMIFREYLNTQLWAYGTTFSKVKTLRLPDVYDNTVMSLSLFSRVTEIDCPNCVSTGQVHASFGSAKYPKINLPGVKVYRLSAGSTAAYGNFTTAQFDWANSIPSSEVSPIYTLIGAMDANEINRIFGELPTVVGRQIDVRYNPGASTCNPAIATAKGWTVNR